MNKELVEQITRLVLERLSEYGNQSPYDHPLDDHELSDWSHLHIKPERTSNPYVHPLSEEELKDWNRISLLSKEGKETSIQPKMVTFSQVIQSY